MPLSLSSEEMDLLLALAQPLEPNQRDQFLREVAAELEAASAQTGVGPGLACCIGLGARLNGAFSLRPNCRTRRRASAARVEVRSWNTTGEAAIIGRRASWLFA
jgi:hypothetical protein